MVTTVNVVVAIIDGMVQHAKHTAEQRVLAVKFPKTRAVTLDPTARTGDCSNTGNRGGCGMLEFFPTDSFRHQYHTEIISMLLIKIRTDRQPITQHLFVGDRVLAAIDNDFILMKVIAEKNSPHAAYR